MYTANGIIRRVEPYIANQQVLIRAAGLQRQVPAGTPFADVCSDQSELVVVRNEIRLSVVGEFRLGGKNFLEDVLSNESRAFLPDDRRLHRSGRTECGLYFQRGVDLETIVRSVKEPVKLILTKCCVLPLPMSHHSQQQLAQTHLRLVSGDRDHLWLRIHINGTPYNRS